MDIVAKKKIALQNQILALPARKCSAAVIWLLCAGIITKAARQNFFSDLWIHGETSYMFREVRVWFPGPRCGVFFFFCCMWIPTTETGPPECQCRVWASNLALRFGEASFKRRWFVLKEIYGYARNKAVNYTIY